MNDKWAENDSRPVIPDVFEDNALLAYHGLTASQGWEWFNSVRGEERFQVYIERAREWMS